MDKAATWLSFYQPSFVFICKPGEAVRPYRQDPRVHRGSSLSEDALETETTEEATETERALQAAVISSMKHERELKESLPAAQIIIALEELGARHSEHAGETPGEIEIEIEAFFEFSKTHPGLLYPAFQMQHDIQRCCRWPFVYKVHPETNLNTLSLLSRALLHSLSLSLSYMHIYAEAKSLGQSSGVATPNSVSIYLSDGKYVQIHDLLNVHVEAKTLKALKQIKKAGDAQAYEKITEALERTGTLHTRRKFRGYVHQTRLRFKLIQQRT